MPVRDGIVSFLKWIEIFSDLKRPWNAIDLDICVASTVCVYCNWLLTLKWCCGCVPPWCQNVKCTLTGVLASWQKGLEVRQKRIPGLPGWGLCTGLTITWLCWWTCGDNVIGLRPGLEPGIDIGPNFLITRPWTSNQILNDGSLNDNRDLPI
jgi:hypothetical protein